MAHARFNSTYKRRPIVSGDVWTRTHRCL